MGHHPSHVFSLLILCLSQLKDHNNGREFVCSVLTNTSAGHLAQSHGNGIPMISAAEKEDLPSLCRISRKVIIMQKYGPEQERAGFSEAQEQQDTRQREIRTVSTMDEMNPVAAQSLHLLTRNRGGVGEGEMRLLNQKLSEFSEKINSVNSRYCYYLSGHV